MKAVCIIPARGGSVRIPRKNIKTFHGRPIMGYSIETALLSRLFSDVVVSTDDMEIASIARRSGANVHIRQTDDGTRGTQEVAREALLHFGYDATFACVLYPCAPMISWRDLVAGYKALHHGPYVYAMSMADGADAGGFYWGFTEAFLAGVPLDPHLVPVRWHEDINTPDDWAKAEAKFVRYQQGAM